MQTTFLQILLLICLFIYWPSQLFASEAFETQDIKRFQTRGEFNEVKEFLLQSIAGKGIKISSTSYISNMLQRTREDVGANKDIFKNAEAIGFCSARLSREMMETNPHNIVFCPYTIVIYELAVKPGTIYLGYRRPFPAITNDRNLSLTRIDTLMSEIISEVIE